MMNKVEFAVVYPKVERKSPNPSDQEQIFTNHLNIGCEGWKTSPAMRQGFCDRIFAGMNAGSQSEFPWFLKTRVRSMSVGDLVNIDPDGLNEWWVCDSCGWAILTDEQVDSWLAYPRQYGCCSFELADWMKDKQ